MRTLRVMVVDDDPDIREVIGNILQFEGYSVVTAADGREALERLQRTDLPDLPMVILLDLMMPTMNGWEFRAQQLKDPRLSSIPMIVLTGDGKASEKASGMNATSYVQKPVQLEKLLSLVQAATETAKSA